ncbi:MAG: hypothetical protein ACRDYD_03665 [Acidimicrobiales bacterium]
MATSPAGATGGRATEPEVEGLPGGEPARPGIPALRTLALGSRPLALGAGTPLDVLPALRPLVGNLRRGSTVSVTGAAQGETSLALALVAGPLAAGGWGAMMGVPSLAPLAAEELGVELSRLALVPVPGTRWAAVAGALVDALDVVVVRPPGSVRLADARRLVARARQRRATLVVLGPWPEGPDLRLSVAGSRWVGLGTGWGHLTGRVVEVQAEGRRSAARAVRVGLWLPAPWGGVAEAVPGSVEEAVPEPEARGGGEGRGRLDGERRITFGRT